MQIKLKFLKNTKKRLLILLFAGSVLITAISVTSLLTAHNSDGVQPVSADQNKNGGVAGAKTQQIANPDPSSQKSITSQSSSAPSPTTDSTPTNVDANNTNGTNHNYSPPASPINLYTPSAQSNEALIDYAHQLQDEFYHNLQKCDEWNDERDAALAPLKKAADEAKQKFDQEVVNTENSQMTSIQKSQRINHLHTTLGLAASKANNEYLNALNNYGSCPYF